MAKCVTTYFILQKRVFIEMIIKTAENVMRTIKGTELLIIKIEGGNDEKFL
jgi:hypothetical protein